MYNKIILIGNLTRTPEVRYATTGTAVCNFGLAVNSRYKQNNETKEEVLFINIVTFGKQAEICGQYLDKGKTILVEGRLREQKWEYEGQKKSKMEVLASNIRFLSKKDSQTSEQSTGVEDNAPPDETTETEPF